MSAVVAAATAAPPSMPTGLTGTPVSTKQINLTWSASSSTIPLLGYYVFRGTSTGNLPKIGMVTATSYSNYGLAPGTKYYYAVQAVSSAGDLSPMSPPVPATTLVPPSAPAALAATAISTKQISLTWMPGTSGAPVAWYRILRGSSPSSLSQVATVAMTSYTDYSLAAATKYYYAVQQSDTNGNVSPLSATVAATTLALPSPPANLTGAAVSKSQIQLNWTAVVTGMPLAAYHVYRGAQTSSLTQLVTISGTKTSFTDYPVAAGTTYYYALASLDKEGNVSALSAAVAITTPR
jgi:titin